MGMDWTQNDFRLDGIDDNVEIYGGGNIQGAGGNNEYTAIRATARMPSRNSNCRLATSTLNSAIPRAGS